ncbi:MAG: YeeE/YedE family protein [Gammaproteobacteria bacterium]|nr:YeeE/YedE family protein [Gammaproteobacteria bacterium]MCF6259631.1 YeeE/YedE family protein [Gammaproteobacteria bacterium]
MIFEGFIEAETVFLWVTFALALLLGVVANKTNFCTMGAVSDWVNMGDLGRIRAWLLAIAVAMLGVVILETMGLINADAAFPPYRNSQLIWAENLLGGVLFGIGMTLASGCGNKTLVRIGGGNFKSVVVLVVIAVIAYFMTNPFPDSDKTLFGLLFYDWIRPLAIDVGEAQDFGTLLNPDNAVMARLLIGIVLVLATLVFVFKSADFRNSRDNILGGIVVGLVVLGGWYVSSNVEITVDEELYSLSDYYGEWDMLADSEEGKPAVGRPLSPQSFTFINPMGQTFAYIGSGLSRSMLTFGIMALMGVIVGSFLWSLLSKSLRFEWFISFKDFVTHIVGAMLMGFGGVLALGCTIGQGITGVSTLAAGSFLALVAIVFGSAITMKVQYYKLVYEEEASFVKALVAGLADMKLLPNRLRKLDAV